MQCGSFYLQLQSLIPLKLPAPLPAWDTSFFESLHRRLLVGYYQIELPVLDTLFNLTEYYDSITYRPLRYQTMEQWKITTLTRLLLISNLGRNEYLSIDGDIIDIYTPTWMNWIQRKISGCDKFQTTAWLLEFYSKLHKIVLEYIERKEQKEDLFNLVINAWQSLQGIRNLTESYRGYPRATSKLIHIETYVIIPVLHKYKVFIEAHDNPMMDNDKVKDMLNDSTVFKKKPVSAEAK